ncbi:MAG TPA: hypothetical protein VFB74_21250, partial [Kribbellaceae bacterium]|nr:hypothetical protein [Kribbellaceae bacterium]
MSWTGPQRATAADSGRPEWRDCVSIRPGEPPQTSPSVADLAVNEIEGRSPGQIAWMRLKRDKVAIAGGIVIILLILMAIFAPLIVKAFGDPPNEFH